MYIYSAQFSSLLETIAEALDISESHYKSAVKRYESIGTWLERNESSVARYSPEIYPQGSFALGTVTRPLSDAEEYDIDLVSELRLQKSKVSQERLKRLVGDEIKSYAHANNMNSRPEESRRCWTLKYADGAQFHMDILPAIPDAEMFKLHLKSKGHLPSSLSDFAIAITDNTLPNYCRVDPDWPRSNPRGYAEWFRHRMETQFNAIRNSLAESIQRQVEDVPEYKVKTPLQRAIQILKRHRDIMFENNPDDKPISIIITTLAGHAYNNETNIMETLQNLVKDMPCYIYQNDGVASIPNPVNPLENFADKWPEHPQREENFYKWIEQVQKDFNEMASQRDVRSAAESLRPRLGERVINKGLQDLSEKRNRFTPTLAASISQKTSHFNVPHRQAPKWSVIPKGQVTITGTASRKGFRPMQIKSDSTPLPKNWSLRFDAKTNILRPYEVYWQVVNTGPEASKANGLRGGFCQGTIETDGKTRKESTLYKGRHWIECFIIKNGICWARSGEFVVNIE